MIERSQSGNVVTVRLTHGKVNALDLEFAEAIALTMNELATSDARAVILTASGSSFSAGVDLFRLVNEGPAYVKRFFPALARLILELFAFPKPLVVAVNGHAIAGGCIFTLCGDYRIMAAGTSRIGIPELLVGVPFPASVLEVIRFAVPPQHLQMLMYTGRTVEPEEALRLGIIDEVAADLPSRAEAVASRLAALPPDALLLAKRQLRDRTVNRAKHYAHELDATALEIWSSDETHARIREYLAKTVKKP
ncbi:MAG TPA: enoyl-CoA hydratase/isomerase family protein [Thermoanaerobaculia bacterium]|nr:enoyl-CoA hydratase/isomerase family protein [Thermoanaerobaculia bacterium]